MAPLRRTFRALYLAFFAASLGLSVWSVAQVVQNPLLRPMIDRTTQEITAATDRMMAREATPARLDALVAKHLSQTPRNWVALQALGDLYAERGLPLPDSYTAAWDKDSGVWAQAVDCGACAVNPSVCTLSNVLICQAPIALTPIGDISGVVRAGVAVGTGEPVDQIDLALSIVGLGATAAILASGGSSGLVKAGASLAKLARRMGRLSPRLTALAADAVRRGVRWADMPTVRSVDDLTRLIRVDAFAPLTSIAADLERVRAATDLPQALHLLPLVDDATDARRLSNAAEALGARTVGRAEVLGKARLLRATVRVSNTAWALMAGLTGLMLSLASAFGAMILSRLKRAFGRMAVR